MKQGHNDDLLVLNPIEERVREPMQRRPAHVGFHDCEPPRLLRRASNRSQELTEQLVAEAFPLLLVPMVGPIQLLSGDLAKADVEHDPHALQRLLARGGSS